MWPKYVVEFTSSKTNTPSSTKLCLTSYCIHSPFDLANQKLQTELSLQQKSEVLLRIQKGESQRKLAEQYGVLKTTIANIKKNEHSIINSVESNCSQIKKRKMRKTENEEVNNITLEFFIKCRAQNIPVIGPMLQAKAAETASSLQIEKFSAGNDWLEAFQCRNNINIASSAEGILEDIMMGRVQGAPLDDEQEVEEEEVDQQPPNRPPKP